MIDANLDDDVLSVRSVERELTFGDLRSDVLGLRSQVPRGGRAGLSTDDAAVVCAAIAALDGWSSEVHLIPPGVNASVAPAELTMLEPRSGPSQLPAVDRPEQTTRWVLYTSGTTGEPKPVSHTLSSLSRTVVTGTGIAYVWGLLYDPNRMAGIQVLLQAMLSGATLGAPSPSDPLPSRIAFLVSSGVNAVSATPTVWRQILQLPTSAGWELRQITLGGEISDQRVLDALAAAFPLARIVHVFASTETGAAFSVKDGREGFPVEYLTEPPRGIRLEIRDDILHVFNPDASVAGRDGFASTGDIVEVVGDRVLFRGRSTGVVNIGGMNVWPEVVESVLRSHPDVVEAVVSSKPNPMTGNVLVARVVLADDADSQAVAKRLRSWVRDRAPGTHVPASITVVDKIDVSVVGKVSR